MRASVAKLIRLACYSCIWLSTLFPSMLRAETTKRAAQGHEPLILGYRAGQEH